MNRLASPTLERTSIYQIYRTLQWYMQSQEMKPFHVIKKPLKSPQQRENRIWFCKFLRLWTIDDFIHVVCSDEFFIYVSRRTNHQNDRVWATSIDMIEERERFRQVSGHPECIGLFVCFSVKKMMFVIKEQGNRGLVITSEKPFLPNMYSPFWKTENVLDPAEVTFLHDKAPCFKSLATQQLLRENNVDFFDNSQWPRNSPDLNPCENLGAIIND